MASKRIKGITIEINGDVSDLSKALKGVDEQLSKTQSALGDIGKLLRFDPGNTELLEQQQRELAEAIETTKDRLRTLNDQQASMKDSLDAGAISQQQYEAYRREILETEHKLQDLEDKQQEVSSVIGTQMQAAGDAMQKYGDRIKGIGDSISGVGVTLTKTVTAPILGLGTLAVKTAAEFDTGMSNVAAISGATGEELDALRDKAREMGASTKFSATEAADAFSYMAMAGWKTDDMMSGIAGIMNLAAASGEDLATTSDIVTDAITAFGLSAEDSEHFADVLAAASSNANTNVSMMGETFKYAAPIAGALGFSIEDTAQAIGLMANSGIKASQAGTALRGIFNALAGEVKISGDNLGDVVIQTSNADGSMRDLSDILADCREAFGQLSESEQASAAEAIVGKNAMSGFLALMNAGAGDIEKLSTAIANSSGSASQMATTMTDNLEGQITMVKSQLQELGIGFGELIMPTIRDVVDMAGKFITKLNGMDEGTKNFLIKAGLIAATVGPAVTVIGKLVTGIGSIINIAGKATSAIGNIITAISGFSVSGGAVGLAIAGVAALAGGIVALVNGINNAPSQLDGLIVESEAFAKASETYAQNMQATAEEFDTTAVSVDYYIGHLEDLEREMDEARKSGEDTSVAMADYRATVDLLNETVPGLNATLDEQTGLLEDGTQAIRDKTQAWIDEQKAAAYMETYSEYIKAASKAEAEHAQSVKKVENAKKRVKEITEKQAELEAKSTEIDKKRGEYWNNKAVTDQLNAEQEALLKEQTALGEELGVVQGNLSEYQKAVILSGEELKKHADDVQAAKEGYAELMAQQQETKQATEKVGEAAEETGKKFYQSARDTEEYQKALEETRSDIDKTIGLFQDMDQEFDTAKVTEQIFKALDSQVRYMTNYANNLKKAAEKGVSSALLAELSDGSQQSAQYLAAIAEMDPDQIAELNESWAEVAEMQTGAYAQALTDGKMQMIGAVDNAFDATENAITRRIPHSVKGIRHAFDEAFAEVKKDNFKDDLAWMEESVLSGKLSSTDALKWLLPAMFEQASGGLLSGNSAQKLQEAILRAQGLVADYTETSYRHTSTPESGTTTTNNTTTVNSTPTINIYQQPGQSTDELVTLLSEELATRYRTAIAAWN